MRGNVRRPLGFDTMHRIDAPACTCTPTWEDSPSGPKAKPCECSGTKTEHGDAEGPVERAKREMNQRHASMATRHLRTS